MLTVKTYLKEVPIKGIGLFAGEFLPKGTIWWVDDRDFNLVFSKEKIDRCPQVQKDFFDKYSSIQDNGDYHICLDNGRFCNHSDDPNTANGEVEPDGNIKTCITIKDINIDDEITCDYRDICSKSKHDLGFNNVERDTHEQ